MMGDMLLYLGQGYRGNSSDQMSKGMKGDLWENPRNVSCIFKRLEPQLSVVRTGDEPLEPQPPTPYEIILADLVLLSVTDPSDEFLVYLEQCKQYWKGPSPQFRVETGIKGLNAERIAAGLDPIGDGP